VSSPGQVVFNGYTKKLYNIHISNFVVLIGDFGIHKGGISLFEMNKMGFIKIE
jgi:hypothetical protein